MPLLTGLLKDESPGVRSATISTLAELAEHGELQLKIIATKLMEMRSGTSWSGHLVNLAVAYWTAQR